MCIVYRVVLGIVILACAPGCANEFATIALVDPPRRVNLTNRRSRHGDFPPGAVYELKKLYKVVKNMKVAGAYYGSTTQPTEDLHYTYLEPGTLVRVEKIYLKKGTFNSG